MVNGSHQYVIVGGIVLLALTVRMAGLGSFMIVDEENWMLRSAGFWHEMFRNANPGGTYMTTHPGATTMWLSGAGIALQERQLGLDIDSSNLRYFRVAATLPIAIATSVFIGFSVWLLMRLFGASPALWAGLLLAVDPYLTGMSQIAHLDALLALFMLNALLAFFLYYELRITNYGLLAGFFSGLALATKLLPSLWLFVVFGAVLLVQRVVQPSPSTFAEAAADKEAMVGAARRRDLLCAMRDVLFVLGIAAMAFYVTWPALWVKDDLARSFQKDVPAVVTQEHVAIQKSEDPIQPASFYARSMLGRTTPFTLVLVAGVLVAGFRAWYWRESVHRVGEDTRLFHVSIRHITLLFLYAVGFLVLITAVAKKADRYALPAHVVWPVLAGIGLAIAIVLLRERFGRRFVRIGGVVLVAAIIAQTAMLTPYAIAYGSPYWDVRPLSQQGWGEGLDKAAAWLNNHPLGERLTVASWYPGVMRTYFDGSTMSLSSRNDDRIGFVVTYRNMYGRAQDDIATDVLDEFRGRSPIYTVSIQGKEYAWVYETLGVSYFDKHVGELVGGMEVGQTVLVDHDNWGRIDIGMSNFSSRNNTEDVIVRIREGVDAATDIRAVRKNAREIADSDWNTFAFDPISNSAGKTYYVSIESPASVVGNAITVRFSEIDIKDGQMLLRRRALQEGEKNSDFIREGDIAYRL